MAQAWVTQATLRESADWGVADSRGRIAVTAGFGPKPDSDSSADIKGDELTYARAPISSSEGQFVPTLTWKRAK